MGFRIKTEYNKFRIFMFAYWAMMLSISGMYTMYIVQLGFSKKEIGICVSLFTVSALIGQNILGYLADRFKCVKKILFISISMGMLTAFAMAASSNHLFITILISLLGLFFYGTVSLSEAWYIEEMKEKGDQNEFGKVRGFGSVGYGFSGILIGLLLQNIGWSIYIWYILISTAFVLVIVLLMPENKNVELFKIGKRKLKNNVNISFKEALDEILKIKPLRSIVAILFMYTFVVKGIYNYLGVLVSDFGGGPLSLGFTYFFDATPEIVTFFLTTKLLKRYSSKYLILVSFILQIIRLALILVFNSPFAIMLLGSLSGFAFGLLASAYKTYIYELAPDKYKISCLSISESIIGLSGVISAPVFGLIIMKFGGNSAISLGLVIYSAIALFLLRNVYQERKG